MILDIDGVKLLRKEVKLLEIKEINSKPHVRVSDLKPNPNNKKIYTQDAVAELAASFSARRAKGLVLNLQPITYWDGMIDIGHSRWLAAKSISEEWIWAIPSDAPHPDGSAPYDEIKHTLDGNLVRKKNWTVKLGEWQAAKDAYRQQYGVDMPHTLENPLIESIGTTKKTLRKVAEIKIHAPELMDVIDNGGGVDHNHKLATEPLNSNVTPAKSNGIDIFSLFKDTSTRRKIITKAVKYAKDMRDLKIEFYGFDIFPFEHEECGRWESGAFTTILSHTFMTTMAGVLKEMGHNVKTATKHKDDPDIYLVDEDEKIEIKCTQYSGDGAATRWSGGRNIKEGKYLLVAHDLDFDTIFVAFSHLDAKDWGNPDNNQKKTMKLSTWFENHKDDAEIWKGNAQIVKSNKMKEGQVKMHLASIDEPI